MVCVLLYFSNIMEMRSNITSSDLIITLLLFMQQRPEPESLRLLVQGRELA